MSEAGDRLADDYRQCGLSGPPLQQETETVLGGFANFLGLLIGAFAFTFLKSELMGATQYWRFFLGLTLVFIVVLFPRGLAGLAHDAWSRLAARARNP